MTDAKRQRMLHEAICALDEKKIRKLVPFKASSDAVFWKGVHKARAALFMATDDQRRESIAWLRNHDSKPYGEEA